MRDAWIFLLGDRGIPISDTEIDQARLRAGKKFDKGIAWRASSSPMQDLDVNSSLQAKLSSSITPTINVEPLSQIKDVLSEISSLNQERHGR